MPAVSWHKRMDVFGDDEEIDSRELLGTAAFLMFQRFQKLRQKTKGCHASKNESLWSRRLPQTAEEITWFVYLKYGESESWESTGTSPPTPTSVGIRPYFPGLLTSTLPEFSDEFPAFPGFRGRYWYRVPLRCGVWWTSRRHDRDEPWLQPCFYAVSPVNVFPGIKHWHVIAGKWGIILAIL